MIETYLYDLCKKGGLRHHFLLQVGSHYPGNNEIIRYEQCSVQRKLLQKVRH